MAQEGVQNLLQIEQAGLTVHQRHHVHPERVLHLRFFVQVVQDDFGDFAALELQHHTHAGLVRFVADFGETVETLVAHQLADLDKKCRLVDLVRQLVDDDCLAVALFQLLDMGAGTDYHAAAAGAVTLLDSRGAVDDSAGWKVRSRDDFHQLVDADFGASQDCQAGIDNFVQAVRWNVGGHPHRDTGRAVDEQIGYPGRQDTGFLLLAVVVGDEIDGLLVDIGQQLGGDLLQAAFGIAVGRRRITVHRTEIALSVDQGVAHREVLRHAHQGFVGGGIAVWMILAEDIADHPRAFHVRPVPDVIRLVHRKQDAPVHRLEAVSYVR